MDFFMCGSSDENKTMEFSSAENTNFGVPTCSIIETEDEYFFQDMNKEIWNPSLTVKVIYGKKSNI